MKNLSLSIFVCLFFASFVTKAQVSASNEPRADRDASGQVIILPAVSKPAPPVVVAVKKEKKPIIRNVSQKRDPLMGKMSNGYYKMAGNHDWGTGARLNSYGYASYTTSAPSAPSAAELNQPVFPAGFAEEAPAMDLVTGLQVDNSNVNQLASKD